MRTHWRRLLAFPLVVAAALLGPALVTITPAQAATTCGGIYRKPGGGYYKCTFVDDFKSGPLDPTKWMVQTTAASGFHAGNDCVVNTPNNVSVSGGYLNLSVRREAAPFTCVSPSGDFTTQYTSATVTTWGKFAQAYGRFEVRAKFPAAVTAGLVESLWMMPQVPRYGAWPWSGEIDIAEHYDAYPRHAIPYVHYVPAAGVDPAATNSACRITEGAFHRYVLEWTPLSLLITIDGATCVDDVWLPAVPLVKPQPFDQPFVLALTEATGVGANAPTDATPAVGTTQVDYVKVWS